MSSYRTTKTPGIYVRHRKDCPAAEREAARCRCEPSYRARRWDLGWSPTFKSREQAAEWKSSAAARAEHVQRVSTAIAFGDLARKWWAGIQDGSVGKRKGRKGEGYSPTTLAGYERNLFSVLLPTFEDERATDLDAARWQAWVDEQSKQLSRSRIANLLAVVSAVYGWGSRPTRKLVPRNPTVEVELPPNDEKPRERVATAEEAAELLAVLPREVAVPYALAFYAGLRRSEIDRLEWADVDLDGLSIIVRKAKSDAGTGRRVPIAAPLVEILTGQGVSGKVSSRSVMSGKLAARARKAWTFVDHDEDEPKQKREPPLEPIGLHECRHTYASLLVAAHYTLKEVMAYMGHADLATTSRYVKMLPQPDERNAADRLNEYLQV